MSEGYNNLGDSIKILREKNDCTQTELGKVLNLPKQSISRIEKGRRKVSPKELDKISKFFNIPSIFILKDGWINNENQNINTNGRSVRLPQFVESFLGGLEQFFDNSLDHHGGFIYDDIKEIVENTEEALEDILKQFKDQKK